MSYFFKNLIKNKSKIYRDKHVPGGARTSTLLYHRLPLYLSSYLDSFFTGCSEPLLEVRPVQQPDIYRSSFQVPYSIIWSNNFCWVCETISEPFLVGYFVRKYSDRRYHEFFYKSNMANLSFYMFFSLEVENCGRSVTCIYKLLASIIYMCDESDLPPPPPQE
jgi:hypothetical protein